jgi:hypothetical protein
MSDNELVNVDEASQLCLQIKIQEFNHFFLPKATKKWPFPEELPEDWYIEHENFSENGQLFYELI